MDVSCVCNVVMLEQHTQHVLCVTNSIVYFIQKKSGDPNVNFQLNFNLII